MASSLKLMINGVLRKCFYTSGPGPALAITIWRICRKCFMFTSSHCCISDKIPSLHFSCQLNSNRSKIVMLRTHISLTDLKISLR